MIQRTAPYRWWARDHAGGINGLFGPSSRGERHVTYTDFSPGMGRPVFGAAFSVPDISLYETCGEWGRADPRRAP